MPEEKGQAGQGGGEGGGTNALSFPFPAMAL